VKQAKDDIILAGKDPLKERRRLGRLGSELDQPWAPKRFTSADTPKNGIFKAGAGLLKYQGSPGVGPVSATRMAILMSMTRLQ
jgi:hypothetical protein